MRFSIVRSTLGALVLIGSLAACGGGTSSDEGGVTVVATTTQVGSIAAELGGDAIDLTVLLKPGIEAHDYEITPADGAAIEQSALILKSGAGLETWLDDAIATIGGEDRVRDLSEGIQLRTPSGDDREEASGEEHAEEVDPHYWMSAPNAVHMVENARDALVEAAPDAADGISERADVLIGRLEAADEEIRALIDEIPTERRKVVTDHDALGYFIDEYGLEFLGSVFPSLDVSADPSARDIEELVSLIRENDVPAIFSESAVNPQLAEVVVEETGATLSDETLYTDSLGASGSGADTLDGMLLHNARVIHDGLLGT
jgi:ABC-type Zn uptake system ZnuABC Zn-binding protein ZnuA